jgi:hypothetical protein
MVKRNKKDEAAPFVNENEDENNDDEENESDSNEDEGNKF